MNLTAEQVKNLNILADFMDGLSDPRFTMSRFTHECGSPACALGWACTIPSFKAQGLNIKSVERGGSMAVDPAHEFFGGYSPLFSGANATHIHTPQQWAAHCRSFLKSNGYPTTDGFKTFMDRVMVPVDTKETTKASSHERT